MNDDRVKIRIIINADTFIPKYYRSAQSLEQRYALFDKLAPFWEECCSDVPEIKETLFGIRNRPNKHDRKEPILIGVYTNRVCIGVVYM